LPEQGLESWGVLLQKMIGRLFDTVLVY